MSDTQKSEIAVLQNEVKNMGKKIDSLVNSLDKLDKKIDRIADAQAEINTLKQEIQQGAVDRKSLREELENMQSKQWVRNTLSAALGALLALLMGYFITNIGG